MSIADLDDDTRYHLEADPDTENLVHVYKRDPFGSGKAVGESIAFFSHELAYKACTLASKHAKHQLLTSGLAIKAMASGSKVSRGDHYDPLAQKGNDEEPF